MNHKISLDPARAETQPDEWYHAADGVCVGPLTGDQLRDACVGGRVRPDTLVWTRGMESWRAFSETPALYSAAVAARLMPPPLPARGEAELRQAPAPAPAVESSTVAETSPTAAADAPTPAIEFAQAGERPAESSVPKPWHRWGARMIDFSVTALALGLVAGAIAPDSELLSNSVWFGVLAALATIPFDALCYGVFGRTVGKALFNISMYDNSGRRLAPSAVGRRTAAVVWGGLGVGLPVVSLFTLVHQYRALNANGAATYDASGGFTVTHGEISEGRRAGIVLMTLLIIALYAMGQTAGAS